jgi:putative endonuclease
MSKAAYVYVMSNASRTLYVGITSTLEQRVATHKSKQIDGFTRQYNLTMLDYFEELPDPSTAIAREKQLKGWSRAKKIALIERLNPQWLDLSADWPGAKW